MIEQIIAFNKDVIGIDARPIQPLPKKEFEWFMAALREELDEIVESQTEDDLVKFVDGVIDLIYFAIGGLYRAGLTAVQIRECFEVIHECNMKKKRGSNDKRGAFEHDAVKPEAWQGPDDQLRKILFEA